MSPRLWVAGYSALLCFTASALSFLMATYPESTVRYGMFVMAIMAIAALGFLVSGAHGSMEQQIKAQEQRIRFLEQRQQAADAHLIRVETDPPHLPPSTDIQAGHPERLE
jgi:hypothetical protein